jgi:DeoR family suf operon transcriptional repressor
MTTTGLTSTKQNILQFLLKENRATAQELARNLQISPQATRRHLGELEAEGLIHYESLQTGMGRPQHAYHLSDRGRALFPHRYGEFAVAFLDTLAETVGEEQVSKVLEKQWQRKAAEYRNILGNGSLAQRVAKLVELRQQEGYMAELHLPESAEERSQFILAEHNCAISEVAESYPSICGHELEMFAAVLPDCTIERTHWINDGEHRCGYLIEAK